MWCACSHSLRLTLVGRADGSVKSTIWKMSKQSTVSSESILCVISCGKSHQRDSEDTLLSPLSHPLFLLPQYLISHPAGELSHMWLSHPHHQSLGPYRASWMDSYRVGKVGLDEENHLFFFVGGRIEKQLIDLIWSLRESPPGAHWEDMSVTEWLNRHCKSAVTPEDSVTRGWGLHQFHLQNQAL